MIEALRERAADQEWRSSVSVRLGLSGISSLVAIVVVHEAVQSLPVWTLALPFGLWVACSTVAPDTEWQHEQGGEQA